MTLVWQIVGPILAVVVSITLFLWSRREKKEEVKIKITGITYSVDAVTPQIKVYWGGEFQRSGRKDVRYVKQVLLKPDKKLYGELSQYFNLPKNEITINERLKLPRDVIVAAPYRTGLEPPGYPVYPALPELPKDTEQRDRAKQIASELSEKALKVGLVWDDSGKTTWKTISKENYGKWV